MKIPLWVYGSGYGDGYGYGYGSGYGDGYGDGYGYGYGYGYGDGYGDGYGYGYGSGYGSGYGYWRRVAAALCARLPRLAELWSTDAFLALWKSSKDGNPSNGGHSGEAARPGLVQKISGPLQLCGSGALHATLHPEKWKGDRLWIVALHGEVAFADHKMGALEREIICEIEGL